jgi:tetrapyrrole methylase family protein/MazG family protein/ATP diphosphatase
MRRLLAPAGCPWDREQTVETLRPFVIEEAYEFVDAIDKGKPEALCEELGDLLLQIVFQSELARINGWFGLNDVIERICDKLVHRHPHIFGDTKVTGSADVLWNWEKLKAEEKRGEPGGVLGGVPLALPALLRALRIGEKASKVGFDWPDAAGARVKISEELSELDQSLERGDLDGAQRELGDLLFSVANLARKLKLDPETALRETLNRFTERMQLIDERLRSTGKTYSESTPQELDELWRAAKADLSEE